MSGKDPRQRVHDIARHAPGAGGRVRDGRPPKTVTTTSPDVRWTRPAAFASPRLRQWSRQSVPVGASGCCRVRRRGSGPDRAVGHYAARRPALRRPGNPALAVSPQGTLVAYAAVSERPSSNFTCEPSMASNRRRWPAPSGATNPFFSPDGQWIGFFAQGKLKKVSVAAGTTRRCATHPAHAVEAGRATASTSRPQRLWHLEGVG